MASGNYKPGGNRISGRTPNGVLLDSIYDQLDEVLDDTLSPVDDAYDAAAWYYVNLAVAIALMRYKATAYSDELTAFYESFAELGGAVGADDIDSIAWPVDCRSKDAFLDAFPTSSDFFDATRNYGVPSVFAFDAESWGWDYDADKNSSLFPYGESLSTVLGEGLLGNLADGITEIVNAVGQFFGVRVDIDYDADMEEIDRDSEGSSSVSAGAIGIGLAIGAAALLFLLKR